MSVIAGIEIDDDRVWYVGSGVLIFQSNDQQKYSRSQAVIPVERLGEMTNEEIGKAVRELVPLAQLLTAEEDAVGWKWCVPPDNILALRSLVCQLEPYESMSEIVSNSLIDIRKTLDNLILREEAKNIARASRRAPIKSLREQIIERDHETCRYCGKKISRSEQIDHVIPYSLGGLTEYDNLVVACFRCNTKKGGKTLAGCGMSLIPLEDGAI